MPSDQPQRLERLKNALKHALAAQERIEAHIERLRAEIDACRRKTPGGW